MLSIDESVALEIERATNNCRMELVSLQAQYYKLIIQGVFLKYMKIFEPIELYSKVELMEMLEELERIIENLELESNIDGSNKYELRQSRAFINECMQRMITKYGFGKWVLE